MKLVVHSPRLVLSSSQKEPVVHEVPKTAKTTSKEPASRRGESRPVRSSPQKGDPSYSTPSQRQCISMHTLRRQRLPATTRITPFSSSECTAACPKEHEGDREARRKEAPAVQLKHRQVKKVSRRLQCHQPARVALSDSSEHGGYRS